MSRIKDKYDWLEDCKVMYNVFSRAIKQQEKDKKNVKKDNK